MNIINQWKTENIQMYQFSTFMDNVFMCNEDNSIQSLILRRIILIIMKARCSHKELANANFKEGGEAQHLLAHVMR